MADNIDKLIFSIDQLSNKIFDNTNSIKEGCNKLEICSKAFVAAVDKLMNNISVTNGGEIKENPSNEEILNIDTMLGVLGFAEITFPQLMDELSVAIMTLLSGGISIPSLLVMFGNFLILTPVGMEIGLSILDSVETWIRNNFGQGVVDAISAAICLITFTGLGALIGGGPVGAIIGFIVGAIGNGLYFDEEISKIGNAIMENVLNLDLHLGLFEIMKESFKSIDGADGFFEIGLNIVKGIIAGILSAMALLAEPWMDLFTWVSEGICNVFGINSPAEEMKPLGENILLGIVQGFEDTFEVWTEAIQKFWDEELKPWFSLETWKELGGNIKSGISEKWTEFTEWWKTTGLYTWWEEDVAPWFTKEQWNGFGENIKTGLGEKWTEFTEWWKTTGLYTWWEEDVAHWFTKEKWSGYGENIRTGLSEKWTEFTVWWKTTGLYNWWNKDVKPWFNKEEWTWSGIKDGLEQAFNNAINSVKQIWNRFASWLNDKLTISWDTFSIGDYEIIPAGTFKLGEIPTFYNGGFPKDSTLFFAGEYGVPEMLGTIGGRTAVASGTEITGIADAVYSTGQAETSLLTAAVNLLQEIASKDMSINIGDREIARANYRGQKSLGTRLITEF